MMISSSNGNWYLKLGVKFVKIIDMKMVKMNVLLFATLKGK